MSCDVPPLATVHSCSHFRINPECYRNYNNNNKLDEETQGEVHSILKGPKLPDAQRRSKKKSEKRSIAACCNIPNIA